MSTTKQTGTVKFYNSGKGFGFIIDSETGNEIFVHATGVKSGQITEGDEVIFDTQEGKKGLNAVNVELA